ncbi:NADH-quinone oxidoreductase subunit E, partial [Klebsiella quasipneumoniae]|nr:NADH-quinone oxidoreductase subunit E [Klebsiella quasipneumoniae]
MHENQQPQTEAFELRAAEREALEHVTHHYDGQRPATTEALNIVQNHSALLLAGAIP